MSKLNIRNTQLQDIDALVRLQREVYPGIPAWQRERVVQQITGTVGNLPVEGLGLHYGQAAIITPSDFPFARDGIAAEGVPNMEQIVITDVKLGKLVMNRVSGSTIPLHDKRIDVDNNNVEIVATAGV